jgi:hypothetical protein
MGIFFSSSKNIFTCWKDPTDEYLEMMMNEAPGPINFTMFLTLFGERLQV